MAELKLVVTDFKYFVKLLFYDAVNSIYGFGTEIYQISQCINVYAVTPYNYIQ